MTLRSDHFISHSRADVLPILIGIFLACASSIGFAAVEADFTGKNGEFRVAGPGVTRLLAGFSATIEAGGKTVTLVSSAGKPEGAPAGGTEQTPFGPARTMTTSVSFPDHGVTLGLRLGSVPGEGLVLLRPFLKNTAQIPVRLLSLGAVRSDASDGGMVLDGQGWLLTSLDATTYHDGYPVSELDATFTKRKRPINEYGGLYRPDGAGFLFGPVGDPAAYLSANVEQVSGGGLGFGIDSVMSGVTVDPGETRQGQEVALWFSPPRKALPKWAEWVGQTHHARHDKGALAGWCSWYHLTDKVTGKDVLGVVDGALKSPDRLRPQVIQIDDGFQDFDGVWEANAKFPEGMAFYAKKIAETGARPGLWVAPTMIGVNAPWMADPANRATVWRGKFFKESTVRPDDAGFIDPTHPRAREVIAEQIRRVVGNGFTYLKVDKNEVGIYHGNNGWFDKKLTSFQVMRGFYADMRKAAGEGTYIQACIMQPDRAVIGLADAGRSSSDASRGGIQHQVADVLRTYHLNRRWMAMDNDIYYMAPDVKSVGLVKGGWDLHRTWLSMMGLSSGAALTSDPWHWPEMKEHIRTVEIMQPPANERAEVLDLCTAKEWPRLVSLIDRPWGKQAVALLWNPGKEPRSVDLQLAQAGLNPSAPHAVWSFWDNKFLGLTKESWSTPQLAPSACQHLVFTPVDPEGNKPALIGSNLHIHSGAAEIAKVSTGGGKMQIDLTDAGARNGDLFVWSAVEPKVVSSAGLEVAGIQNAGEHAWKVGVRGRKSGVPQRLVLE
jgi:hypothetical protein